MNPGIRKGWIALAVILFLTGLAWASGLVDRISLENIQARRDQLLNLVDAYPLLSLGGFVLFYALAVALSLPIATLLSLVGGFLFGRWLGTLVVVIGATIGATGIFLIARTALGRTLREKASPLYQRVVDNMANNAVGYMLFMRLVPIFPFFLVNVVPAFFNVRLLPYVLTTFVGIMPGSFVYTNLGRELGTLSSLKDLMAWPTLLAFCLLGLFALTPTVYRQLRSRRKLPPSAILADSQPTQENNEE